MEMSGIGGGFGPTQVWDTVQSWFTPTVLFLLVNIVIGTIAVSSRLLGNSNNNEDRNALRRAPSLLNRLPSMSFYRRANDQAEVVAWTEPQEAVAEDNVVDREVEKQEEKKTVEKKKPSKAAQSSTGTSGLSQRTGNVKTGLGRSKSDAASLLDLHPPPPPLPGKIKKSETFELTQSHARAVAEEEHIQEEAVADGSTTDGVDAKADDFINKFKQQLKLQRLESLMRYKDTLNRKI